MPPWVFGLAAESLEGLRWILCLPLLQPSPKVSQLRPHGVEAVWDTLTHFSQVQGVASAMVTHGNDSGPGGQGS